MYPFPENLSFVQNNFMGAIFQQILSWYMVHITYWTIFLLMTIESTIIPFPSELVIPPAAFKAANGDMNIFLVIFSGSMGALFGSLINYFVFLFVWKQIIRIVSFISSKTRISFENLWNWTTEDVGIVELIQH